jgi:hypothetical protein
MTTSNQQSERDGRGAPQEVQRLHSLIGEWEVHFETRSSADGSFRLQHITSRIISILGGAFLQEQLSIPASAGKWVELMGILGYDRYRERYRFAWLDDTYAVFDVHEGNWAGEALVMDNIHSGTTFLFGEQEYFSKMTWHEITADEFRVVSDLSMDGGRNWFTQAKGHYIRLV